MDDFTRWLQDSRNLCSKSVNRYRTWARTAGEWLADNRGLDLEAASPADLKAFYSQAVSSTNSVDRRNIRPALIAYFDYLIEKGRAEENLALELRPSRRWGLPNDLISESYLGPFSDWLQWHRYSLETQRGYLRTVRHCALWLSDRSIEIATASADHVLSYDASMNVGANTHNNNRSGLLAYYKFLIEKGVRVDNPAEKLTRWKEPKRKPKPISAADVEAVIAASRNGSPMVECLFLLFINTGLRRAEIAGLRWDVLVDGRAYVAVKGGDERVVQLNSAALEALERWKPFCPKSPRNWVFPSRYRGGKEHISNHQVWLEIQQLGERAGIQGLRPHRLRHTFGTELYRKTKDLLLVKEGLGHVDIGSTMCYAQGSASLQTAIEGLWKGER